MMNYSDIACRLKDKLPDIAALLDSQQAALTVFMLAAVLGTSADEDSICKVLDDDKLAACEKIKAYDIVANLKALNEPPRRLDANAVQLDVSSAREMQIEALQRGKGDFANWFAVIVFLACFAMIGVMLLHGAATINDSMRFYVLGFLQSVVMAIVGFYFGSSAPSRKQHAALLGQTK